MNELASLNGEVQLRLPLSHRYQEMIPYHYFLFALYLRQKDNNAIFWKARDVFDAKPGDILVYIDPQYDPDPDHRQSDEPSGTHIAFVDDVVDTSSDDLITLRIIDSSKRKSGRGFTPDYYSKDTKIIPQEGGIAYSILSLKLQSSYENQAKNIYDCKFLRQRKSRKLVLLFYPNNGGVQSLVD